MTPEDIGPGTEKAEWDDYMESLIQEVIEFNLSGPGAAARLYDAGLNLQETQRVLGAIGYQAYANTGDNRISVSVERFDGKTPIPAHYPSQIVSFKPEDERPNWLSEIE